jgi:hypothetical protein
MIRKWLPTGQPHSEVTGVLADGPLSLRGLCERSSGRLTDKAWAARRRIPVVVREMVEGRLGYPRTAIRRWFEGDR